MNELVLVLFGLVMLAGFVLLFLRIARQDRKAGGSAEDDLQAKISALQQEKSALEERARLQQNQLEEQQQQLREKDASILDLNKQVSAVGTELRNKQDKLDGQDEDIRKMQEQFRMEFKNLANEILEEKTLKFTEHNKTRLEELLKPLGEKIVNFEKKVEEAYNQESKERFSLAKELKNLADLNQQISREANNLTNALKGQAKTRGNWGEIILESILEKSGLTRDREFFVQQSHTNEHGKKLQPDVVVSYPGGRHVVIDSKVSLVAYERYASAETREEQDLAAREHLASVKNHIADLSSKDYQDLYTINSIDFVMLFMPVEPAYLLAMQTDPNLWAWAYDRRILLISPTNLIAALRMIANLWRVEYQNKHAMEIARQSGELYDKFASWLDDLRDIGSRLEAAQKAYDTSMNKLYTGKGNLIRRVEHLKTLGARAGKEIPKSLLDKTEGETDE